MVAPHKWLTPDHAAPGHAMLSLMDTSELRAAALAKLIERGIDPPRVLPPEALGQLRATFEALDEDGDGSVDLAELRRAIADPDTAPFVNDQHAHELLEATDIDGDGRLSLDELVMMAARRKVKSLEQAAWNTFAHFDADADGFVDRAELARLTDAGATDVDELLTDVDGNRDGKIDFGEFLTWYTDHHDRAQT